MRRHRYVVDVRWTGDQGSGTTGYTAYRRDHEVSADGRPVIAASSDPAFRGDPARWSPEQLFVAALSQCHMLWYLHLAAEAGVVVTAYEDHPEAVLEEDDAGSGRFTEVTLRPQVTVREEAQRTTAAGLHERAHAMCFLARSVSVALRHEGLVLVADG